MHGMLSFDELMFQIDFEYTMPKYDNGSVPNICLSVRNFKLFFPYIEHLGWGEGSMEFIEFNLNMQCQNMAVTFPAEIITPVYVVAPNSTPPAGISPVKKLVRIRGDGGLIKRGDTQKGGLKIKGGVIPLCPL